MTDRFEEFAQKNSQEKFSNLFIPSADEGLLKPKDRFQELASHKTESTTAKQEEEGWGKWFLRTAYQIPSGIAHAVTYPLDLIQSVGYEEATDPFEIEKIKRISEQQGIPFDEEKYLESAQSAAQYFPTQSNIEKSIEENFGVPLEAKTRLQKGLKFASSAGKLSPKGYGIRGTNVSLPRPILGGAISGTKEIAQEVGVPEPIAEIGSFGILKKPSAGSPSLRIGKKLKPSGLPERRYESLNQKTNVSEKSIRKINQKVENDFRQIAENILEEAPISETRNALQEDASFKSNVQKQFKEVERLSDKIPDNFSTEEVKKELVDRVMNKKGTGYSASEYNKKFRSEILSVLKDTPTQEITATDLIKQYRKNNRELSQVFEPGQSFSHNKAKRDALLEHNKAIASIIEKKFPDSEFSNLFSETNNRWASIMDAEAIDKFLDSLFKEKIDFKKGRKFFDEEGMTLPFKRAMGKEGFAQFETLMKDLMTTEKGSKLLKKASSTGYKDLAETAGAYILHPTAGKAKLGWDALKGGYKKMYEMLLDKPKIGVHWNRGINAMKKGDFKAAEFEFNKVKQAEIKSSKGLKEPYLL